MFKDRVSAGKLLTKKLPLSDSLILGIPRGGMVVAKEIAQAVSEPLYSVVTRKIGAPHNPELAIGAVGPDQVAYWDEKILESLHLDKKDVLRAAFETQEEVEKRIQAYDHLPRHIKGKDVVIVDDGVATGATAIAACLYVRKNEAKKVILATPVVAKETKELLKSYFDEVIALEVPDTFDSVGQFYKSFPQITDSQVKEILNS